MRLEQKRATVAVTVAALTIGGAALLAIHAGATGTSDPVQPDANEYGTVALYDAAGTQVVSGNLSDDPISAYALGSAAAPPGSTDGNLTASSFTKATLILAAPQPGENSQQWPTFQLSASTKYPVATAPSPVGNAQDSDGNYLPVVTGNSGNETLATGVASFTPLATTSADYGIYELRIYQSGPGVGAGSVFEDMDISVDTTAGTWHEIYPTTTVSAPPTSPTTTPTSPTSTPTSPTVTPTTPTATPTTPTATPTTPTATPTTPTATPTTPTATPTTPTATPTSTTATPTASTSSTASGTSAPSFTSPGNGILTDGVVGTAYDEKIAVSGDPTPTVSVVLGALPEGLSLSGDPSITGTPTVAGTYHFTLQASNSAGSAESSYTLTVVASGSTTTTGDTGTGSTGTSSGSLPFTGLDVVAMMTLAGSMILGGAALRRAGTIRPLHRR